MQTVTLKSVLDAIARREGKDPDSGANSAQFAARACEFLNHRFEDLYKWAHWGFIMLMEQRAYRDAWSNATTYSIGDEVWLASAGKYYSSLTDSNLNNNPDGDTVNWEELTTFERYVAYEQTGQTVIESVESVSARNPRTSQQYPGYLSFTLTNLGVLVSEVAGNQVWVQFRKPAPQFTTTAWSSATTYSAGQLVYVASTGEAYKSLQGSNLDQDPTTETAYWEKVDFPAKFKRAIVLWVQGDLLDEDQQTSRALVKYEKALESVQNLEDEEFEQNGQVDLPRTILG